MELWRIMTYDGRTCGIKTVGLRLGMIRYMRNGIHLFAGLVCGVLVGMGTGHAQTYTWRTDVLPILEGLWVKRGQDCKKDTSQIMIFSTGGYRWRTAPKNGDMRVAGILAAGIHVSRLSLAAL